MKDGHILRAYFGILCAIALLSLTYKCVASNNSTSDTVHMVQPVIEDLCIPEGTDYYYENCMFGPWPMDEVGEPNNEPDEPGIRESNAYELIWIPVSPLY